MKLGSLFDGSGGFPLAGALCGITPVWASEVEPYPITVTRSRFPSMRHLGDVSRVSGADIEPVDIITFGSPCQDLSGAGKRAGLKHTGNGDEETTRSGLFMEAVRIIKEMREKTDGRYPAFALWENVPGAFSSNGGEDFRIVLAELAKIADPEAAVPRPPKGKWPKEGSVMGDGWSLAWRVLDAQYWGVPQRRRRIYLVADFAGERAGKILFERPGLRGYFAEGRAPRQAAPAHAGGSPASADREGTACICYDARGNGDGKVAPTITGDHNNRVTDYTALMLEPVYCLQGNTIDRNAKQNGDGISGNIAFTLNAVDRHAVAYSIGNGQPNSLRMEEVAKPLDCMHDAQAVVVMDKEVYNSGKGSNGGHYIAENGPAPSLRADSHPPAVCTRYIVRRLTPTECARMQGFPDQWGVPDYKDDFTDAECAFWQEVRDTYAEINKKPKKRYTKAQLLKWYNRLHTDSAEYKMWGNGIALPTALYVMQGIAEALGAEKEEHTG